MNHNTKGRGQFQGVLQIRERISSAFTVTLGQKISGIYRKNGRFEEKRVFDLKGGAILGTGFTD